MEAHPLLRATSHTSAHLRTVLDHWRMDSDTTTKKHCQRDWRCLVHHVPTCSFISVSCRDISDLKPVARYIVLESKHQCNDSITLLRKTCLPGSNEPALVSVDDRFLHNGKDDQIRSSSLVSLLRMQSIKPSMRNSSSPLSIAIPPLTGPARGARVAHCKLQRQNAAATDPVTHRMKKTTPPAPPATAQNIPQE